MDKNTLNIDTKSQLAKLLATENITVQQNNVKTASFDVVNRILTLPIFKTESKDVTDMLVAHECAHALYTPTNGWKKIADDDELRSYVNVLEDCRIDAKIQKKYPGVVNNYLNGLRDQVGFTPDTPEPVLTAQEVGEIKGLAGGDSGYDALMEWAGQNLDKTAQDEYDAVLATANKTAIKFAVTALMGQYEDSQGRDSRIVTGKQSSTENYRSMAEVVRDMNKPEYQTDEAFRDDVIRKLSASNLKV